MFRFTRALPFAALLAWLGSVSSPLLKLLVFMVVVLGMIVLGIVAIVTIIVDIILIPVRLLL